MVNSSTLQREWLRTFWRECGIDEHKCAVSRKKKAKTIEMLQLLGSVEITKGRKQPINRAKFNKVKYFRHRFESHRLCFACREPGQDRHHIIWLKHGGLNSKKNLVTLCRACHAEIHPWLKASGQTEA